MFERIKSFLRDDSIFYSLLILCIGVASFGLGQWSDSTKTAHNDRPATIIMNNSSVDGSQDIRLQDNNDTATLQPPQAGKFVGSVNSDKYHLPYCSGAQRIRESNKIWFTSEAEARAQGYTPAGNCPGL